MKPIIEVITYQPQGDTQEASEKSVLSNYRPQYQQLIKELLGATELKREQTTLKKETNQHKISQSIAYTPIDQSNKYTNHIQHCLWILFISKTTFEDKIMSGLLHFPASILSDHGKQTEAFIQIIKQYQETLNNISHTHNIFYGGGTIRPSSPKRSILINHKHSRGNAISKSHNANRDINATIL